MNLGDDIVDGLRVMHAFDPRSLQNLDDHSRAVKKAMRAVVITLSAAERTSRKELKRVRVGMLPGQAKAQSWVTTRPLRLAASAMRKGSGEMTAYYTELTRRFIDRGRDKKQSRGRRRATTTGTTGGGFDILGGIK